MHITNLKQNVTYIKGKLLNIMSYEEFEDTKVVIRIRKSKNRQHNGQKDKQRSTKHTRKTKDQVTPLKTRG
jgi:hypothetical protein